ncbi:MAG: phage holin family protein [Chloroflexota bacterium]|nr:phage holin family protein [Chloroflexota bacterium]
MAAGRDDRSLGELFAELAHETSTLVRQELRQAGTEIGQRATGIGKDVGLLAAGAVIVHAAFLALVTAIILGLIDLGLDWWLATLIVALVLAGIGYAVISRARSAIKHADILPHHTMDNLKEDQEWAKEQIS